MKQLKLTESQRDLLLNAIKQYEVDTHSLLTTKCIIDVSDANVNVAYILNNNISMLSDIIKSSLQVHLTKECIDQLKLALGHYVVHYTSHIDKLEQILQGV
jgi:hypothetical protein